MSQPSHRSIIRSGEGIPLVFGDGKYPQDPPQPASPFEADLWDTLKAIADVLDRGTSDERKLATINRLVHGALVDV